MNFTSLLRQVPLGSGLAEGGADVIQMRQAYERQYMDAMEQGQQFPDFETWLKLQQTQQANSAQVILPR